MNTKKFDMSHLPSTDKRPLEGEYKKTILLLYGPSNTGKSTLADLMLNDNFNYISIDRACLDSDLTAIKNFIDNFDGNINYDLGMLFKFVNEQCLNAFVNEFFTKYIADNENQNIFIEGYLFMLERVYNVFMIHCRDAHCRVWKIGRVL